MSKKKKRFRDDIVYSTEKNLVEEIEEEEKETLPPEEQLLHLCLDRKGRAGKSVSLVTNFVGTNKDLKELGKVLKSACGVGGTTKNGCIEIQGDFRDKIERKLHELNYKTKKIAS